MSNVEQSREFDTLVNRASFLRLNSLDDDYYEIGARASRTRIDLPVVMYVETRPG